MRLCADFFKRTPLRWRRFASAQRCGQERQPLCTPVEGKARSNCLYRHHPHAVRAQSFFAAVLDHRSVVKYVHRNLQNPPLKQRRIKLLDVCVERFPEHDARVLASLIIQGKVLVDDAPQYKAGTLIVPSVHLRIRGAPCKFVSRRGCTT